MEDMSMQIKKSLLIAGAVTTIGLAGITGTAALAMGGGPGGSNHDSLINRLSQKFNINETDIRAVFNEVRLEKEIERLQRLVDDGKITPEQKTLIENKIKEIWAAHDLEQADLRAWSTEKGIDLKYLKSSPKQLQKLVEKGELTAEKKTVIKTKQQELKAKHEAERTALIKWAKDNGINEKYLWGFGRHDNNLKDDNGHHGGPRH